MLRFSGLAGQFNGGNCDVDDDTFATEIDPVAAVLQRLRMPRIARNVSSLKQWSGGGESHNSCDKKPKSSAQALAKSTERWPSQQLLPLPASTVQVRFNQMGTHGPKSGQQRATDNGQLAAYVGLTIGEISSKTIKN